MPRRQIAKKNTLTFEQLLAKHHLSELEQYVLNLSKERQPTWEVIAVHQKVPENVARASLGILQIAIFTELTKQLREKQGALLGECDTLFVALKKALELRLINKKEYQRGLQINSASNMAKHRVEPEFGKKGAKKKGDLELSGESDSDQGLDKNISSDDGDVSSSDEPKKRHSSDSESEEKEPIAAGQRVKLKGQHRFFKEPVRPKKKEDSDEDLGEENADVQRLKGMPKFKEGQNLVEHFKNERFILQQKLNEAIFQGNLPEIMKAIQQGASLQGPSYKERYQQIDNWIISIRKIKSDNGFYLGDHEKRLAIFKAKKLTFPSPPNYMKVICPMTAAVMSLNTEILDYVQLQLGNQFNWNLVCCDLLIDLLIKGYITGLSNDPSDLILISSSYKYRYPNGPTLETSEILKVDNPSDDITLLILLHNLLTAGGTTLVFNPFKRIYTHYETTYIGQIDQRPMDATYEWLAKWYEKYGREQWVDFYNEAIYGKKTSWQTLIKTLMICQNLFDSVGARSPDEKWDSVNKKNVVIPFPEQHDKVVMDIVARRRMFKEKIMKHVTACQDNYYATVYKNKEDQKPGAQITHLIDKMMPRINEVAQVKLLKYGSFELSSSEAYSFEITYTTRPDYPVIIEPFQFGRGRRNQTTVIIHSPTPEQLTTDIRYHLERFAAQLVIPNPLDPLLRQSIIGASLKFSSTVIRISGQEDYIKYYLNCLQKFHIINEGAANQCQNNPSSNCNIC